MRCWLLEKNDPVEKQCKIKEKEKLMWKKCSWRSSKDWGQK